MDTVVPASDRRPSIPTPVRVCVIAVGAYAYGFIAEHLPAAQTDATIFWIGNLAAPFVLIPFLAGAWHFRPVAASAVGALAGVAAVAGFYDLVAVARTTAVEQGLPTSTPTGTVIAQAYANWFRNLLLGDPGGRPWLAVALVTGLIFGYLGYTWARKGSRLAASAVAAVFIVEPLVHVAGHRYNLRPLNLSIWGLEALIGVAGLAWVWLRRVDLRTVGANGPSNRAGDEVHPKACRWTVPRHGALRPWGVTAASLTFGRKGRRREAGPQGPEPRGGHRTASRP